MIILTEMKAQMEKFLSSKELEQFLSELDTLVVDVVSGWIDGKVKHYFFHCQLTKEMPNFKLYITKKELQDLLLTAVSNKYHLNLTQMYKEKEIVGQYFFGMNNEIYYSRYVNKLIEVFQAYQAEFDIHTRQVDKEELLVPIKNITIIKDWLSQPVVYLNELPIECIVFTAQ